MKKSIHWYSPDEYLDGIAAEPNSNVTYDLADLRGRSVAKKGNGVREIVLLHN